MKTLCEEEIAEVLAENSGWKLEGGKLVRDWIFGNFEEAISFVNNVAALAEQADHHPDIDIRYNRVRLGLISHDANGITGRDARMAARLNAGYPPQAS